MVNYKILPQFKIYLLKYAASALNQTKGYYPRHHSRRTRRKRRKHRRGEDAAAVL